MSGSSTLCVLLFVLYGFEPDQCKQMSVSISGGCTSTVTHRHSYRKRLAAFGVILVELRDVADEGGIERLEGCRERNVGIRGQRKVIHERSVLRV